MIEGDCLLDNKKIPKKYASEKVLIIVLAILISIITFYRIKIQFNIGPLWDTFAFLANALEFASKGFGYSELGRPPLLSFLTSLFFRLSFVSEKLIFMIDGLLFIFGVLGLYFLFRLRFNILLSFLGCFLFVSFPIVLKWVSVGYTDLASLSFSIWALYFTLIAIKKNQKFLYLAFSFLALATLTRYSAGLIFFPMILCILMNPKVNFKYIVGSMIIASLFLVPYLIYFYKFFGNPFAGFFGTFSATTNSVPITHFGYRPYLSYYLINLPSFISYEAIFLILFAIFGLLIYLINSTKNINLNFLKKYSNKKKIKLLLLLSLLTIFILTFGKYSYIYSEIIFFVFIISFYVFLKDFTNTNNFSANLVFLLWFMVYFIFHSSYPIKVERYFISMAPSFTYFILLGIKVSFNQFSIKIRNIKISSIISLFFIIFILFSITISLDQLSYYKEPGAEDVIAASNWLKNYDSQYQEKTIYSNYFWPHFSWYLKMNVKELPLFHGGKSIQFYSITKYYNSTITEQDNFLYCTFIESHQPDYIFSIHPNLKCKGYIKIKSMGTINIYKKS
jgi:hypothetical protein